MSSLSTLKIFLLLLLLFPIVKCFFIHTSTSYMNDNSTLRIIDSDLMEESRKKEKKNKLLYGLIVGAVLVKLILFPLAVKAMAVMSSVSVFLSTLSLIMSSIVGYAKLAYRKSPEPVLKFVHINDAWSKGDEIPEGYEPYGSNEYGANIPVDQIHYSMD